MNNNYESIVLKSAENEMFSISLKVAIFYDLESMDLTVILKNKVKSTQQNKSFNCNDFSKAMHYYNTQVDMFI